MTGDIDGRIVEYMKPMFGEFAGNAFQQQKVKIGIGDQATRADYMRLVESIRSMCAEVAGDIVAAKVYAGLVTIVREAA
jgi:hypothetical protein